MPVAVLLAACAVTPDFSGSVHVTLESIEPADQAGQVVLQLNLKNESATSMLVAGMNYRLAFNGVEFTYGTSRQAVRVPAHGEAVFDITAPGSLPVAQPGAGGDLQLAYRLTGKINLADDRGELPFAYAGALTWQGAAGR